MTIFIDTAKVVGKIQMIIFIRNKQLWNKKKISQFGIRSSIRKKLYNVISSGEIAK